MQRALVVKRRTSDEFLSLVRSQGYEISAVIEFREAKNPKYFISTGKVEEIESLISGEIVLIDGILKSSQWYTLEKRLNAEVHDRIKIIIDIFADRAKSREAMLQVEYARLKYQIPLVREMIHHRRMGEHAGWMGGGEYEVSDYYEMIRKRLHRIKIELQKIERARTERRKRRREEGFVQVGMAGYTNAGKSTLLKRLTDTERIIENRMFSTLSTKTARMGRERILITDTVGFVEDMPPWLINAFKPTLEEIYMADVVIFLIDGCDSVPEFRRKYRSTMNIIEGKVQGRIIPVINKIDCTNEIEEKIKILEGVGETVLVSASTGEGIETLIDRIKKESGLYTYSMDIGRIDAPVMDKIRRFGRIENIEVGEKISVRFTMREDIYKRLFST